MDDNISVTDALEAIKQARLEALRQAKQKLNSLLEYEVASLNKGVPIVAVIRKVFCES